LLLPAPYLSRREHQASGAGMEEPNFIVSSGLAQLFPVDIPFTAGEVFGVAFRLSGNFLGKNC